MESESRRSSPELSPELAEHIIQRLSEAGQPPELGVYAINVGTDSYLRVLETEYFGRLLRGGSSFKLVEGYFGGGKTHFLYCVRETAWAEGFAASLVELSPTECPYDDPLKVYQAVARNIALPPARGALHPETGLIDLLADLADDLLEKHGSKAALTFLRRTVRRIPCESHSYRQAVLSYLRGHIREKDKELALLGGWLSGESATGSELKELAVFENMSRSNGFTMLRSMCQMLVGLGLPGIVLLFDEVDRQISVGPKRIRAIGDNLRQVIDLCGRAQLPNTMFLYAVPPEFMRNVVPEYPALYQRLRSPIPFSFRAPQAPIIDLQQLDMEPIPMLEELGDKILTVFQKARGVSFDRQRQLTNISTLARQCVEGEFELNHRRLFVKVWTDALFRQAVDGESDIASREQEEMVVSALEELVIKGDEWEDLPEEDLLDLGDDDDEVIN